MHAHLLERRARDDAGPALDDERTDVSLFGAFYARVDQKQVGKRQGQRTEQMYGISRLAGELAVMAVAPQNSIIIRTCGLYGLSGATSKGGNFVDMRIADAKVNTQIEMGCDQVVSPTFTNDLAYAVLKLVEHPDCESGIYHLVNQGECTWFEFTKAIYELLGLNTKVLPVDRGGVSGEMRRPLYSTLANYKAKSLGIVLPHWQEALGRYLNMKCK